MSYSTQSDMKEEDFFTCKTCGDCCKGYGGTYVTEKDIKAIADFIKTDAKTFVSKYCRDSGKKQVLAQGENGYCIFWDKLCTIHPVKPRMCKAWPFIESVLIDKNNWNIMANSCPGIRTDVSYDKLRDYIQRMLNKINGK